MTGALTIESLPYSRDTAQCATRLADQAWFIYLDSCITGGARGRYDILACHPRATLMTVGPVTELRTDGTITRSRDDPFSLVDQAVARLTPAVGELPFAGGAIGYFGYDLGRRIERLPAIARRDIDLPDMAIGIYDHAIVVDHQQQTAGLLAPGDTAIAHLMRAAWLAQSPVTPPAFATSFEVISPVRPELSFAQYGEAWRRIKRYIEDGDVYQVNLAQRFSATVRGASWDAYQRLRNVNPAPYSAYFAVPGGAVLSSSPERFIKVARGLVETKPIKGTRPRSPEPAADARLAAELLASLKDRAENVMIVDLLRNDLGKVCRTGSVKVTHLCAVESFTKVHHLVSTVEGVVRPGISAAQVLRACFPGGSITGAPKIRAMEIIEELEPQRRGIYCGALGYLSSDGQMDTNIAIRTLAQVQDRLYCWAGGGIVHDSELDAEYAESLAKASALLEVFTHAEIQGLDR